ncbi:MAG: hypothetical protein WA755_20260 [Candidatus Acidiferrales bacterium]
MTGGFYKRRRGILEHIESGTIDLLESGIHDYLSLKANLLIGGPSSIPVGICFTSAPAIHVHCPRVSERTIQRCLEHMEKIGWLKAWKVAGKRGNYPVLVCRGSVHDVSGNEYRINGEKTTDWRKPAYEPVRELSGTSSTPVLTLSGYREERTEIETKTKPKTIGQQPTLAGFALFWESYPRKVGKPAARRAWLSAVKADDRWPEIMPGLEKWKACVQWLDPQFVPHPATFLNQKRWEDEPPKAGSNGEPAWKARERERDHKDAEAVREFLHGAK